MLPCDTLNRKDFSIGHISVDSLKDALRHPNAQKIAFSLPRRGCEFCALLGICGGTCLGLSSLSHVRPMLCEAYQQLYPELMDREGYSGIIAWINSGGGSFCAAQDMVCTLARAGLPPVAVVGELCASAAYYFALGFEHIIARPASLLGGLRSSLEVVNYSKAHAHWGMTRNFYSNALPRAAVARAVRGMAFEESGSHCIGHDACHRLRDELVLFVDPYISFRSECLSDACRFGHVGGSDIRNSRSSISPSFKSRSGRPASTSGAECDGFIPDAAHSPWFFRASCRPADTERFIAGRLDRRGGDCAHDAHQIRFGGSASVRSLPEPAVCAYAAWDAG